MKFNITDLSEEELNLLINSLAQQPYIQVFKLVEKIQKQFVLQSELHTKIPEE